MPILTANNLVRAVSRLPKNRRYDYINSATNTKVVIVDVNEPEGPICIKRFDPSKGKTLESARVETISSQMIWRVANAITEKFPFNIDRILGASYNTRSAFETLLAYTPEFHFCYPGRIEKINITEKVKEGHKHLIWMPNDPHDLGTIHQANTEVIISEIPSREIYYDSLYIPTESIKSELDIEVQRRHSQIQIALLMIGKQLGFRTWIAQNDRSIKYKDRMLSQMEGVIDSLNSEALISSFSEAIKAAKLVDCIWFKNGRLMPAVMEIEHTTGVRSGLDRMKNLQDNLPPFPTRYVIVTEDGLRDKVVEEANKIMFKPLNTKFFPYSAVEELYYLCERRKIHGVTEEFLDSFMEPMVN